MARKHREPASDAGTRSDAFSKHASTDPEECLGVSPARPLTREWASSSYDPNTGRPCVFEPGPNRYKQMPKAGTHTCSPGEKKSTKPGRW